MSEQTPRDYKPEFTGRHVQFVGMSGNTDGPIGKVWRVTARGVWVTLPDGSRQQWHPEDVAVVPRPPSRRRSLNYNQQS